MATLVAFTATMGPVAADEAIEVFDLLMGDLVRTSGHRAGKDRRRTMKELDSAAIVLRQAWMPISRTLSDLEVDLREMVVESMDVAAMSAAAWAGGQATCRNSIAPPAAHRPSCCSSSTLTNGIRAAITSRAGSRSKSAT